MQLDTAVSATFVLQFPEPLKQGAMQSVSDFGFGYFLNWPLPGRRRPPFERTTFTGTGLRVRAESLSQVHGFHRVLAGAGTGFNGQPPCRDTAGLKPALEGGKRDVQLVRNALLRALAARANFVQRLFPEFLRVWCSFPIYRSGADHPHGKKGGDL